MPTSSWAAMTSSPVAERIVKPVGFDGDEASAYT
jgi:hypothetical protein